jgi:PAS domain-containing protein
MPTQPLRPHLRLPRSLLGGVRGFLLGVVLVSSGPGMLPAIALAANESIALRLAAGLGILALDAWYIWGYRHQRLPAVGLAFEAPVLALVAVASGGPERALPIVFPSLIFRVFHSSLQGYVGAVVAAALAYVATGLVLPALHGVAPSDGMGLVGNLMAMPLMGSLMYAFSLARVRLDERTRQAERLVNELQVEIAERHRAEEALGRSEARYRLILETTQEAVWLSDASQRTTFVNARMAQLLGRPPDEILGRSPDAFLAPEDAASLVSREGGVRRDVRVRRAEAVWGGPSCPPARSLAPMASRWAQSACSPTSLNASRSKKRCLSSTAPSPPRASVSPSRRRGTAGCRSCVSIQPSSA